MLDNETKEQLAGAGITYTGSGVAGLVAWSSNGDNLQALAALIIALVAAVRLGFDIYQFFKRRVKGKQDG